MAKRTGPGVPQSSSLFPPISHSPPKDLPFLSEKISTPEETRKQPHGVYEKNNGPNSWDQISCVLLHAIIQHLMND